jgi:hypothetical protein
MTKVVSTADDEMPARVHKLAHISQRKGWPATYVEKPPLLILCGCGYRS